MDARIVFPNQRYGVWSLPHDSASTRHLAMLFAELCARINKGNLLLAARDANGVLEEGRPSFDEEYEGFARVRISAGSSEGDVLIVFPNEGDGRPTTVHTMGHVENDMVDKLVQRMIEAIDCRVGGASRTDAIGRDFVERL